MFAQRQDVFAPFLDPGFMPEILGSTPFAPQNLFMPSTLGHSSFPSMSLPSIAVKADPPSSSAEPFYTGHNVSTLYQCWDSSGRDKEHPDMNDPHKSSTDWRRKWSSSNNFRQYKQIGEFIDKAAREVPATGGLVKEQLMRDKGMHFFTADYCGHGGHLHKPTAFWCNIDLKAYGTRFKRCPGVEECDSVDPTTGRHNSFEDTPLLRGEVCHPRPPR